MAKEKVHPLVLRASVAESVAKRFKGQTLTWGEYDCARLAHETLRGLGLASPFDVPRWTTERGAIKAMKRAGFDSLEAVMDSTGAPRIAPAAALPADILGFQTESSVFGMAIGVALSGGRCMVFADHAQALRAVVVSSAADAFCAWRLAV